MSRLDKIALKDFRNIEQVNLEFSSRVNVFHGENAQGKTNLLEAIYFISGLKSFRTRKSRDLIRSGAALARMKGLVTDSWGSSDIAVDLKSGGRRAMVNGRKTESITQYLRILTTVIFSPQDMALSGSEQRVKRKYLDRAVFQGDLFHLDRMRKYERVLKQRNAAIASGAISSGDNGMEPWNEELAKLSVQIRNGRSQALDGLIGHIREIHSEISGGKEKIDISIDAELGLHGVDGIMEHLEKIANNEKRRGHTLFGPHRDKVIFKINGREVSEHASQGQRRTLALSLKLALLQWVEKMEEELPAFLLDDPGSELDRKRLGYLGERLSAWKGQIFIATVGKNDVPMAPTTDIGVFNIEKGRVFKS